MLLSIPTSLSVRLRSVVWGNRISPSPSLPSRRTRWNTLHPGGKVSYRFLMELQHGNVDTLKMKNTLYRQDLPPEVALENFLNGYPHRGRVGFMLQIAPTVAFKEAAKIMRKTLLTMDLDKDWIKKKKLLCYSFLPWTATCRNLRYWPREFSIMKERKLQHHRIFN